MANGMAGYIGEEEDFEHSLSLELVETIIENARENKVYYELCHKANLEWYYSRIKIIYVVT